MRNIIKTIILLAITSFLISCSNLKHRYWFVPPSYSVKEIENITETGEWNVLYHPEYEIIRYEYCYKDVKISIRVLASYNWMFVGPLYLPIINIPTLSHRIRFDEEIIIDLHSNYYLSGLSMTKAIKLNDSYGYYYNDISEYEGRIYGYQNYMKLYCSLDNVVTLEVDLGTLDFEGEVVKIPKFLLVKEDIIEYTPIMSFYH